MKTERYHTTVTITTTRGVANFRARYHHDVVRSDNDQLAIDEGYIEKVKEYHESLFGARANRQSLVTKIIVETTG